MPAWPKFALMFVVAAAMVVGFDVRLLTLLDAHVGGPWLSIALTVLWLVAVTNAMNFMDNMDGLSAGVGAVASSLFLITALMNGQWFIAALLALLIGALLGFLCFNAPRKHGATIFMGDGGSLVLGFLLAFLTVKTTYSAEPTLFFPTSQVDKTDLYFASQFSWWERYDSIYAVLMPLCILAVPLYDMASVIVIRLRQGRSPFVGDRQHFSHRLLAAGLSVRRTLAVICGCTAITGISGIMLSVATGWQAILIGIQVLLVLAVIALYEHGKGWPFLAPSPASAGEGGGEGSVSTTSTRSNPRAQASEPHR
jgi:UDP-GlcNAc:undecaprenyl-phosphate GlcNAc-1-phosphate transferase